jgi:hypothetical protein
MEMYYVREYTPTCRFLKIINSTLTGLVDYFYESTVGVYYPLLITTLRLASVQFSHFNLIVCHPWIHWNQI